MNCKMIFLAAGFMMMLAGCNENEVETKAAVAEQPAAVAAAPAADSMKKAKPASETIAKKISVIEWNAALEMQKNGAVFVDVRNPQELKDGMVQGSINIPLPEIKQRFAELPKDKDLLVYCRSGRRSEVATYFLMQQGYEKVHNVLGGFLAYPQK